MDIVFSMFTLLGGLALFLYGMNVMSDGLGKVSGGKLEASLKKLSSNKFKALLLGAGITVAVQSSSAVTVMLVGLVNSGILEFNNTFGMIMGSNVGTTLTAWLLSLAGLEGNFFNNRLNFSVDYFDKRTKDLLFRIAVDPALGVDRTMVNGGSILNSGLEFELGWKDTVGDFTYSVNANFSTLHNEVLSFPGNAVREVSTSASSTNYPIQTAFEPGYPVWYLRGFNYEGVDADGKPVLTDVNEDGTIDDNDMNYIGQGTPKFTYGLTLNMAYKGFDFVLYGAGQGGNHILPVLHRTHYNNTYKWYLEAAKNGTYPSPDKTLGQWNFWSSNANLFKGDFFRIKQLQLGYTLPSKITKKAAISNLRLFVSLDDFFTFTAYPGLDPETASTNSSSGAGLDWGSYPTMQKVLLGVNLTF